MRSIIYYRLYQIVLTKPGEDLVVDPTGNREIVSELRPPAYSPVLESHHN